MRALADFAQIADVIVGQPAAQHEASQRIALPVRTVLRPFKDFFENFHLLITKSISVRDTLSLLVDRAFFASTAAMVVG